jgi:hypothetical protein
VQRLADQDRGEPAVSQDSPERLHVAVRADDPQQVSRVALLGGPPRLDEHVGLGIDADHRAQPAADRQRQLPGATAQIHDHIPAREAEVPRNDVHNGRWISTTKPRIEFGPPRRQSPAATSRGVWATRPRHATTLSAFFATQRPARAQSRVGRLLLVRSGHLVVGH